MKQKGGQLLPLSSLAQPTSIFPLSLGPCVDPMETPHLGRRLYLECTIFHCGKGPAIDTTQTGPSRRSRHQKHKFHCKDPVTDIIRKQLKLRTKGKTQTHLT